MTNSDLLNAAHPTLQVLANGTPEDHPIDFDGATTTPIRYAVIQNQRRLEDALEGYQEMLKDLIQEHDVEMTDQGGIPDDAPEEFTEALQELLEQETPFDPYTVTDEEVKAEPDMPLQLLGMMDWMVE